MGIALFCSIILWSCLAVFQERYVRFLSEVGPTDFLEALIKIVGNFNEAIIVLLNVVFSSVV